MSPFKVCSYLEDHAHDGQREDSSRMGRRPAIYVITSCQSNPQTTIRIRLASKLLDGSLKAGTRELKYYRIQNEIFKLMNLAAVNKITTTSGSQRDI